MFVFMLRIGTNLVFWELTLNKFQFLDNEVHSASWVQLKSFLEEVVAAPV
jgi:hypothetical protein